MKVAHKAAAAVFFLATSCAGSASASVWIGEYSGVIAMGKDASGVFAEPGSDLAGQGFTLEFLFATNRGNWDVWPDYYNAYGSEAGSTPGPVVITRLHVNAVIVSSKQYATYLHAEGIHRDPSTGPPSFSPGTFSAYSVPSAAYRPGRPWQAGFDISAISSYGPVDLDHDFTTEIVGTGTFYFTGALAASGTLSATTLRIYQVDSFVPEPTAWMIMLLGFGTMGAAVRRRRMHRLDAV